MHKMENTPKTLTLIAMVFEGITVPFAILGFYIYKTFFNIEFLESYLPSQDLGEIEMVLGFYDFSMYAMLILAGLLFIVFIINMIFLRKLMNGKCSEEEASKLYTYQLIIGIVEIFVNTISGVCHIVSAVQGKNRTPDKVEIREGI